MAAFSSYLGNKILDLVLNGVSYAPTGDIYVALFSDGDGLDDNAPTGEITNIGYTRIHIKNATSIEFTTSVDSVSANNNSVIFGPAGEDWDPVTHIALMDSTSGGNVLFWSPLPASRQVDNTESLTFAISELRVALI